MPSTSPAIPKGPKAARKKAQSKVGKSGKSGKVEKRAKVEKAEIGNETVKVPGTKTLAKKSTTAKRAGAKALNAHVFLIAVKRRREAMRVYAVLTPTEQGALDIVRAANDAEAAVEPVGRLSKKLARPLKLMAREPRLI